jgi:hypothetical protein
MMKKTLVSILIFCALFISSFATAFAWDDTGHKLTAYIAWQQMNAQARERAAKILLSAPEDSDLSVFYLQDSRSAAAKQRELFMIAATWADIVRDKNFKTRYSKYHHGNWHYLDTFWREVNGKIELVPELKSDEQNAVERLFAFDKVLRDVAASDSDKAIALAWILHIGGDIHQPLHDSARVTKYDPKGDQGGNLFMLSPKGATGDARVSLHWFWDSIIGRNVPRVGDACDSDYLPAIAEQMMKKYPLAKMRNRLEIGKFDQWQKEGFEIASTKLYPASLKFGEMPSEGYKKMAFEIAQEQIALAGYRLGEMLNQILDASQTARQETVKEKIGGEVNVGQSIEDQRIQSKAQSALTSVDSLNETIIEVSVLNGVVTLSGMLSNKEQDAAAKLVVKKIAGVKQVIDKLKVVSKTVE